MKSLLLKPLVFLRLVDAHDGSLSLTNVAMYVALTKLAVAPQAGVTEVATLLLALLSYSAKKVINRKAVAAPAVEDIKAQVASLETKVAAAMMSGKVPRR